MIAIALVLIVLNLLTVGYVVNRLETLFKLVYELNDEMLTIDEEFDDIDNELNLLWNSKEARGNEKTS